jgi:hypothetical protein
LRRLLEMERKNHMTQAVTSRDRPTRRDPCPICQGGQNDAQHQGVRCAGFRSRDGRFAFCTREEYAGRLALTDTSPPSYRHALQGQCGCDREHGAGSYQPDRAERRRQAREEWTAPRSDDDGTRRERRERYHAETAEEKRPVGTVDYIIRDRLGAEQAIHRRHNFVGVETGKPSKTFTWHGPDGSRGLGGRSAASLPLYGIVVITEGEKAADALRDRNILALATSGGAQTIPSDDVLRSLLPYVVVLWADNDDDGRAAVERIAARLVALGTRPRIVQWAAPNERDDAADYPGDPHDLIYAAQPYVGRLELGASPDREALRERMAQALEHISASKAREVEECGTRFVAWRCASQHLVGKRQLTCGVQDCPTCGPMRFALDWQQKVAPLVAGLRFRLSELRPKDQELAGEGSVKALRQAFVTARRRKPVSAIYGLRLERGLRPVVLLAEVEGSDARQYDGLDCRAVATGVSADELRDWLQWHYLDEMATAWDGPVELALLLAETKGRHRFQAFGHEWRDVGRDISLNAEGEEEKGNKSTKLRPPSGGSGRSSGKREPETCPICGDPMERVGVFGLDQVVRQINDGPWYTWRPLDGRRVVTQSDVAAGLARTRDAVDAIGR